MIWHSVEMVAVDGDILSANDGPGFENVGIATYVASAIFNAVALPPNMPDFLKAAIEAQAEAAQRLPDVNGVTIGNPGGGAIGDKTKAERQQEEDEDFSDRLVTAFERQREQERVEWERTESTVAGVTMTGEQWQMLADRLQTDEEFRRRLTLAIEAKGATHEEALERVDHVAAAADAAGTPPSQRTAAQKALLEHAKHDATLSGDLHTAANELDRYPSQGAGLSHGFNAAANTLPPVATAPSSQPAPRLSVSAAGPGF